jgi:hypothetical protein
MNGLSGARVLVLDDEPDEALPIIKAFSRVGVPVAYFDGKPGQIPRKRDKLHGVRLAILDMDLGFGGPPENMASTMLQTLARIIRPDNGPYGVLIWTKHPDQKETFARFMYERSELPNPVFVVMLKKADFLVGSPSKAAKRRFSIQKLAAELVSILAETSPLEFMQVWEGSAFRAATNVTNTVAELSQSGAETLDQWKREWHDETLKLLLGISRAQAEAQHTRESCIPSLFLALNPLHSDRMDALVKESSRELTRHTDQIMQATGSSKLERRAKVNSMLHLASNDLEKFSPGNVYLLGSRNRSLFPALKEMLRNSLNGNDEAARARNLELVVEHGTQCGIEISAACDYAQDKMGLSRVIVGVVLPHQHKSLVKRADSLKTLGPFYFDSDGMPAGVYNIYLDSRYVAAAEPKSIKKLRAVARVRPQLLADIQFWVSYQAARQGVVLLPDK